MRQAFKCFEFNKLSFYEAVEGASSLPDASLSDQARYLASYLLHEECGARSFIREDAYVDRHFLEEYTGYYANTLHPPSSKAARLHFFRSKVTEERLHALLDRANAGEYSAVCSELSREYLGFCVVRPLPFAPIGRTVLQPYRERTSRCFEPASTRHRVHLAGLELDVEGVPFQQQDQAVGACATTAIWSALARVMRTDGNRATTPLAITSAATRHLLSARALPASAGLDFNQMLAAIRTFGYSPDVTKNAPTPLLQLILKTYIGSGIPVILQIQLPTGEYHAVTVVGFREDDDEDASDPILIGNEKDVKLQAKGLTRLFVHDDRLGPYARMCWLMPGKNGEPRLCFTPDDKAFAKFEEPVSVYFAIAPLYPKLRLSADDLIGFATQLLPTMQVLGGGAPWEDFEVELRFRLGGEYAKEIFTLGLDSNRARDFALHAKLSRYVGVIRFRRRGEWFADVLCDTTDIRRNVPDLAPILAMTPREAHLVGALANHLKSKGSSALVA